MQFGKRLKTVRTQQHRTQATVAQELKVSRQTISSWETGHSYPDIDSLIHLSTYYGLSLDALLKEDPDLTETLRKPVVLKEVRPILHLLLASDCIFLVVTLVSNQVTFLKFCFWLVGLLTIIAINRLRAFTDTLNNETAGERWRRHRKWIYGSGLIVLGLAGLAKRLALPLATDPLFFAGVLWAVILISELSYHHNRPTDHTP